MCVSGFAEDNPPLNSAENAAHIKHHLLRYTVVARNQVAAPDCADSADCGLCPR